MAYIVLKEILIKDERQFSILEPNSGMKFPQKNEGDVRTYSIFYTLRVLQIKREKLTQFQDLMIKQLN